MARPNPTITKYIEKHLSKGFEIKHIKRRLAEAGHPIEAIEDAATFVLGTKPPTKKKIPKFMIIYGLILIIIISAGIWFFWFKATEYTEYTEEVGVVEQKLDEISKFEAMSSLELLKYAAETGNLDVCEFIDDHNIHYACTGSYWERDDCSYELAIGEGHRECVTVKEFGEELVAEHCTPFESMVQCRIFIAAGKDDISICEGSAVCIDAVNAGISTIESCSKLPEGLRDGCLMRAAIAEDDRSICDLTDEKTDCLRLFARTDEEVADFYNDRYSIRVPTGSKDEVFEFVEGAVAEGSVAVCRGIEGSFGGVPLNDICLYYYVYISFSNYMSNLGDPDYDSKEGEPYFIPEDFTPFCSAIVSQEFKGCCSKILTERLINPVCAILD